MFLRNISVHLQDYIVLKPTWPHTLNISHHESLITSTSLCLNKHKSGNIGVPVACLLREIMDKLLVNNISNKPSTIPIKSLAKNMQNLIWLILCLSNIMTCYETNMASTIFPSGNKVQFEKKLVFSNEYKKSFLVIWRNVYHTLSDKSRKLETQDAQTLVGHISNIWS